MQVVISNKHVVLTTVINQGGAGVVYEHPSYRNLVVKIYIVPATCEELRIKWLCANPPSVLWERGRPTFGWPTEPVYDTGNGEMIGFVMPKAVDCVEAQALVDPSSRLIAVSRDWLIEAAISFLTRLHSLHLHSYLVGDINFRNFLIDRRGVVTFIDVDSFHFTIPQGPTFSTMGCRPELQPPELVEAALPFYDRGADQDAFSAYVVVYRMLCEGAHPFSCLYLGQGDVPLPHELIRQAIYPDALRNPLYRPLPCKYPLSSLPMAIQQLFRRMFDEGLLNRDKRPNVTDLLVCLRNQRSIRSSLRGRVGRRAWRRQLDSGCHTKRFTLARKGLQIVRQHKGKVALATCLVVGYGAELCETHFLDHPPAAAPIPSLRRPQTSANTNDTLTGRGHAPATRESVNQVLLPTPKLWREATNHRR